MAIELKPGVYWVGVIDWELRQFHGHELSTHRGSTYNSYLIIDEKIALVDTVWSPFAHKFIENIKEIINPSKIDYIIVNHSEVDHAGSLAELISIAPDAQIIASPRGLDSIEGHFRKGWKIKSVKTGDRLPLGKNEILFIEAPMLHWPDSMFSYLTGLNILMPNDAFGQHYATAFRFNDQVNQEELYEEALKYYANILTPFSERVLAKIEEFIKLNLPVDIIAPSHGVIWRKDPLQIVKQYQEWASQIPEKKAVIIYDTMWNGTRKMAEAIGEGLSAANVEHKIFNAATADRNDIISNIFKVKTLLIGSPTLNNGLLPTILPLMQDIKGLKFKNKIGGAFGSYGWSGECVKIIEEHFHQCGIPLIGEGIRCKWQPSPSDLQKCKEFGLLAAKATLSQ